MSKKKSTIESPQTPVKIDKEIFPNSTESIDETVLFERIAAIIETSNPVPVLMLTALKPICKASGMWYNNRIGAWTP
jgi:hypothetical protein